MERGAEPGTNLVRIARPKGFETIINSELEPAAATFADFRFAQSSVVKSLEQYKHELDYIRSQLPRRDVMKQYERAVICI